MEKLGERIMKENFREILSDSQIIKREEKFNLRWNIINEEDREKLRFRCVAVITNKLNEIKNSNYHFNSYNDYLNSLCVAISMIIGIPSKTNNFSSFESKYLYDYIMELDLKKDNNYIAFIKFIEEILNYDYLGYIDNYNLAKKFAEAFKLSNVKMKIIKDNDEYCILPINTEFLDSPLVFDNLYWLNAYKDVKNHFEKSLKFERKENYYRNIVDELRLSLELLLKKMFSNEKSLENQKSNLGDYFKSNNISTSISNMYIKLFDYYTLYNNDNAKHDDKINNVEIDYLIYLTGTFIRFIMQIEESKKEVK